jgi:hypothetical protein
VCCIGGIPISDLDQEIQKITLLSYEKLEVFDLSHWL